MLLGVWLLPPLGEGGDGGQRRQFSQPVRNRLQHAVQVQEQCIRRKAQHCKPLRPKEGVALQVVVHRVRMLGAVQFDNQLGLQTGKVRHIAVQRMLAAEFHTELPAAQARPQPALGIGHAAAQGGRVAAGVQGGLVLHGQGADSGSGPGRAPIPAFPQRGKEQGRGHQDINCAPACPSTASPESAPASSGARSGRRTPCAPAPSGTARSPACPRPRRRRRPLRQSGWRYENRAH